MIEWKTIPTVVLFHYIATAFYLFNHQNWAIVQLGQILELVGPFC